MAAMKEQTRMIFDYVREHADENITSQIIADALGLNKRSVDGSVTSFQKKGWTIREDSEIDCADGTHKKVKFIRLTELGATVDPDAAPATDKE